METNNDFEYNTKLVFHAQWYDYDAKYEKNFFLSYFPYDNTLELYDTDSERLYLRRALCEDLHMKDFFVGNKIRVYGRQIELQDYANDFTRTFVGRTQQHAFGIIKPSAVGKLGEIINAIQDRGFYICRMRMATITRKEALVFYEDRKGDVNLPFTIEHIISGPIVAVELVGVDAINRWAEAMGPSDPEVARKEKPDSLRALYGESVTTNGIHGASSHEKAVKEACYFFPEGTGTRPPNPTAKFENSTCCIIKPHAISENKLGYILTSIMDHELFEVSALSMIYLTKPDAEEFLDVYKGVVSDYNAMLLSFLDGPCVVMEISGKKPGLNVYQEFRKFTGPMNSDIARQVRPYTLRGMYGVDQYRNAVHCTDLPEDTLLELEYFFKILD